MEDKNNLKAKILDLVNLVDYQQGAVVSKALITKKTGTVTLFAFDKDQTLSEHTAPFDAMVYVIDGRVEVIIADNPYILEAGQMIIMPANQPHSLKALDKFKMALIMIKS